MSSYNDFAYIYDNLIEEDYDLWTDYIEDIFKKYDAKPKLVLDLACGTGSITTRLAKRGYDMIGIDLSEDMLSIAMEKATNENLDIRFIRQDMTSFELYGSVDAIICTLDAVNYITSPAKLQKMFELVKYYLNPNGIFIFDISSEHKLTNILGNNSFINDLGDIFYTWENEYNLRTKICKFFLTFFIKNGAKYERIDEVQSQRIYKTSDIDKYLKKSGLKAVGCFDSLSFKKPAEFSERVFFVAKEFC